MRPRHAFGGGLGALAAVGIAAGLWLGHWTDPTEPRVYADSYQYLRLANEIRGDPHPEQSALRVYCAESGPKASTRRQQCVSDIEAIDRSFGPRYRAVFRPRVGFPLVLAAMTATVGSAGLPLAPALVFVGSAAFLYAALRTSGRTRVAALIAVALFGVLPSGVFSAMLLSEGTLMLGTTAALYGIALLTRRGDGPLSEPARNVPGLVLLLSGLTIACLARGIIGATLAAAFAVGALAPGHGRPARRTRHVIAGVCGVFTVVAFAVPALLHQPGILENLQLQATDRFTRPDVSDPWRHLLHADEHALTAFVRDLPGHGYSVALALTGLAALIVTHRRDAWPWLAPTAVAVIGAVAYPEQAAAYRFLSPLWISVAVGFGAAAEHLPAARPARRPAPDSVAEPAPATTKLVNRTARAGRDA